MRPRRGHLPKPRVAVFGAPWVSRQDVARTPTGFHPRWRVGLVSPAQIRLAGEANADRLGWAGVAADTETSPADANHPSEPLVAEPVATLERGMVQPADRGDQPANAPLGGQRFQRQPHRKAM